MNQENIVLKEYQILYKSKLDEISNIEKTKLENQIYFQVLQDEVAELSKTLEEKKVALSEAKKEMKKIKKNLEDGKVKNQELLEEEKILFKVYDLLIGKSEKYSELNFIENRDILELNSLEKFNLNEIN